MSKTIVALLAGGLYIASSQMVLSNQRMITSDRTESILSDNKGNVYIRTSGGKIELGKDVFYLIKKTSDPGNITLSDNHNIGNVTIITETNEVQNKKNTEEKLVINGVIIDILNKKVIYDDKEISQKELKGKGISISKDFRKIKYKAYRITIDDKGMLIEK